MGDDFAGLLIDKNNPASGNYRGKIATVNSGRFCFSDFEWEGKTIERDDQIFRWVNSLATQLDVLKDIQKANIKADTIEEYVAAVKPFLTNTELWGTFTLGGREYYKDGFDKPNYNLYFPKKVGSKFAYSALMNEKEEPVKNLIRYDAAEHIIKADKEDDKKAESFEGQGEKDNDDDLPM